MNLNLQSLWDDDNFKIQAGVIPAEARVSGAGLGPGVIFYPHGANLARQVAGETETASLPRSSTAGFSYFWSMGPDAEVINLEASSYPIIHVELKPSPQWAAELLNDSLGVLSAGLLEYDWAGPFKDSVHDDLDAIGAFVEPLGVGKRPDQKSRSRALLAKQDLDLKLLWTVGELHRLGVTILGSRTTTKTGAASGRGMINVTVNTVDSAAKPVGGCEVRYVPVINSSNSGYYRSFSQFSTPTSESLSVGNYEMWAEKLGQKGATRSIGIVSSSNAQTVDLFAP